MARITIEDCLAKVPSRFELVHLAAQRVRQIREGSEYLVSSPKNEDIVVALREIAAGKVTQENIIASQEILFSVSDDDATDESDLEEETTDEETESEDAAPEEDEAEEVADEESDSDSDEEEE